MIYLILVLHDIIVTNDISIEFFLKKISNVYTFLNTFFVKTKLL